jgi:hypothetical protein
MWLHDDLNLFVSSSIITIVKLGSLVQHLMATCIIRLLVLGSTIFTWLLDSRSQLVSNNIVISYLLNNHW